MTSRRGALAIAILLLTVAAAGCLSGPSNEDAEPLENQTGSDGGGPPASEGPSNASVPEPPIVVVDVAAEGLVANTTDNGTVYEVSLGVDVVFDASNSTDPAGGNLSYRWQVDGLDLEGPIVNHTFGAAGNHSVVLTATSDASGLAGGSEILLSVVAVDPEAPAREPVVINDPEGDATTDFHDILQVVIEDDGESMIFTIRFKAIQPADPVDTLIMPNLFIDGTNLEAYRFGAGSYNLWDNTNGRGVSGSSVSLSGTTYTIKVPFAYFAGPDKSYEMFFASYTGEGFAGGLERDDRAPDQGTVTY